MELFLLKLDICYNNMLLTKNIDQKEKILNKSINLIRYNRMMVDFINYLHTTDATAFTDIIKIYNRPSLILLTYNLESIGNAIELPNDAYIELHNNLFQINYKTCSPQSNLSCEEWGLSN